MVRYVTTVISNEVVAKRGNCEIVLRRINKFKNKLVKVQSFINHYLRPKKHIDEIRSFGTIEDYSTVWYYKYILAPYYPDRSWYCRLSNDRIVAWFNVSCKYSIVPVKYIYDYLERHSWLIHSKHVAKFPRIITSSYSEFYTNTHYVYKVPIRDFIKISLFSFSRKIMSTGHGSCYSVINKLLERVSNYSDDELLNLFLFLYSYCRLLGFCVYEFQLESVLEFFFNGRVKIGKSEYSVYIDYGRSISTCVRNILKSFEENFDKVKKLKRHFRDICEYWKACIAFL